jgi:hypothetical protein
MVRVGGGGGEVNVVSCAVEGVADITSVERMITASAAYLKAFISVSSLFSVWCRDTSSPPHLPTVDFCLPWLNQTGRCRLPYLQDG